MTAGTAAPPLRFAEVVLPLPVARGYTYLIPPALAGAVVPGARVVVPVRRRRVIGIVRAVDAPPPPPPVRADAARPVLAVADPPGEPAFTPPLP
ncbi:MAG: replication restart helicase PriA, partial [Gemmatimonadales bacterium]